MDHKFKYSDAEVKTIKGIQFGVISPDFMKKISVTQTMEFGGKEIQSGITTDNCYDQTTGLANLGAINDPRMGSVSDLEHPGYFGHIELVTPVYHINFIKTIINILKCVSFYTSELLVTKSNYVIGKKNLKEMVQVSKSIKKCPTTDKKLPTYTKEGAKIAVDHGSGKEIISPKDVHDILKKISDEDVRYMGFDPDQVRPEWFLITVVSVPPLHVRPSVFMSSSQKCDDDLTTKLNEIVKANIGLSAAIKKYNQDKSGNNHYMSQLEALLQYNVNTFIDNQHPGQPPSLQRSGKPLKTLKERLAGKEGRVRGNLMGKRSDFTARTVITADPNLSLDEVGVPVYIAKNLTIPETVTSFNKERLMEFVKNGPTNYPGAKFIIKNGMKYDLKIIEIKELQNGWVVERHLINGDFILFNRQPSLHKMSIMGHKVRVLPKSTFRINLACTSPYNADFDGDEMNMHVPQSLTARAEIENLMMVNSLIVSPQSNKPVIGVIQDSLLSSCKMSRRNIFIEKFHVMNIIAIIEWDSGIPNPALILREKDKETELWTGKQILSLIIPNSLFMSNLKDKLNPLDKGILIQNGKILSGSMDKNVIGKSQGGLIHLLFNDYGPHITKKFLNLIQKISNYWIKQYGFSIGIGDAIPSEKTKFEVEEILNTMKNKITQEVENNNDKDPRVIEEFINSELNAAVSEAGKKAEESLNFDTNNFKATVSSGSKGSSINISQIMVAVGQQNVEGRRINYGFKNRTLPHYEKHDIGQESRGFVENSYVSGLTPQEFFFHAMAGREGLIDTACKSVTGDTNILIMENGITKCVKIGEWIDEYMNARLDLVEKRPWAQDTEVIDFLDTEEYYMPTADKQGNTSWGRISHLTRHDPGELVYLVKTQGGREVKVVESKSLLIWNPKNKLFEQKLTSEIKIGEFVPVTISLPEPPVIQKYISMDKYIHQYSANIDNGEKFPDTFELNNEFGIFIGLFLAEGHTRTLEGSVNITNSDIEIKNFIKKWFDKLNIKWSEKIESRTMPNGNIWKSSTIQGYSTLLAKFLHLSLGHKSEEIYIPDFAFNAQEEFITGLLGGYFSGDGNVDGNCVSVGSVSEKLINGISFLCSRLGVFGTITNVIRESTNLDGNTPLPMYIYSIRGHWSKIFSGKVKMICKSKQYQLDNISEFSKDKKHNNYNTQNDVVLDPVISIEKLDPKDYPKVYDVTIPTTDNFSCFNGILEKNTSETGYIQRRLVKALEDISVKYDGTVRNSKGLIIQYLYGDDGIDATFMENVHIKIMNYNLKELKDKYYNENIPEEFEIIKETHRELIEIAKNKELNNAKQNDDYFTVAVNISRIIRYAENLTEYMEEEYMEDNKMFEEVNKLCDRISHIFDPEDLIGGPELTRSYNATRLFRLYIRSKMATKMVRHLTKSQFIYVIEDIEFKFRKVIVQPGEMVGILAAQSIGEPATQMSAIGSTQIIVLKPDNTIYRGSISNLIDKFCTVKNKNMISEVINIKGYKILGVNQETEKNNWNEISQVSRHPTNGKLIRVKTQSGKITTATLSHSFLKRGINCIIPTLGSELKLGNRIPIVRYTPIVENPLEKFEDYKLTNELGITIGKYLIEENNDNSNKIYKYFENNEKEKYIAPFVFNSNLEFISGILFGYFNNNINKKFKSKQLLDDIIILLSYFGIFVNKTEDNCMCISAEYNEIFKEKFGFQLLNIYENFDIIPNINHILHYIKNILNIDIIIYKLMKRSTILKYINKFENHKDSYKIINEIENLKQAVFSDIIWDKIISLEILNDPNEYVYDFTVPGNQSFMVDCNILVHNTLNTFHYAGVSSKNMTLGVPRLKELINVTRKLKTPSTTLYDDGTTKDYAYIGQKRIMENVRSKIEYKTIQDILISSDIIEENNIEYEKDKKTIELFKKLYAETDIPIIDNFLSLRLEFNSKDLEYVDTSMIKLCNSIELVINSEYKIICSDDNDENDNLFIRIITNYEDKNKAMYFLRKIEIQCMNIKIKGYEGIEKVYIREGKYNIYTEENGHHTEKQWIFETEGSNMLDTFIQDKINHNKTISNNIIEIYEILGIEAARQSLLNELKMVLSFDGSYVNFRHLEILVDTMTARGILTSVTRHGLNRNNTDSGPLTKCTFEETVEVLTDAAAFGEYDALKGVSDNIMFGQMVPCGTGVFDILYDLDIKPESKKIINENIPILYNYIPTEPNYNMKLNYDL